VKNKFKILVVLFSVFVIFTTSCSDEFEYERNHKLLVSNDWQLSTYVNYSDNQTTDFRPVIYNFEESDILLKTYEANDTVITSWELSSDADYVTIGSNTFKITEISRRVLSLRYGEIEMFFVAK
jgi:hypothetical protein